MSEPEAPPAARPPWRNPFVLAFIAGIVLVTLAAPRFRKVAEPPAVTGTMPAHALVDQQGAPLQLQGRVALVGLVSEREPASSRATALALAELQPRFGIARADVAIVLIDLDGRDAAARRDWLATAAPAATGFLVVAGERACEVASEAFQGPGSAGDPCATALASAQAGRLALVDASGRVRGTHGSSPATLYETFERTLRACDLAAGGR